MMRRIQSESRREATKSRLAKPKTLPSDLSEFKEASRRFSDRNAIIHDLEPHHRGIYSGAIGYFDFTGDMNTCIAIRTMIVKDGKIYFQSGAGIVYDSNPSKEFDETINKAKAINSAIDLAERGLVE